MKLGALEAVKFSAKTLAARLPRGLLRRGGGPSVIGIRLLDAPFFRCSLSSSTFTRVTRWRCDCGRVAGLPRGPSQRRPARGRAPVGCLHDPSCQIRCRCRGPRVPWLGEPQMMLWNGLIVMHQSFLQFLFPLSKLCNAKFTKAVADGHIALLRFMKWRNDCLYFPLDKSQN